MLSVFYGCGLRLQEGAGLACKDILGERPMLHVRAAGSPINISNRVRYMLSQLQKLNARILDVNRVRGSVITHWLSSTTCGRCSI